MWWEGRALIGSAFWFFNQYVVYANYGQKVTHPAKNLRTIHSHRECIIDFECPDGLPKKFHNRVGMSKSACLKPTAYSLVWVTLFTHFRHPNILI